MALPDEERLHKGLGVREPGVVRSLSEEFVDRLRIFPDDPPERGLAKIIWQLSGVILRMPVDKPKWVTVLRVMYNLDRDPVINPLVLKDRLEVLYQRHGRGWHPSTTNTKLSVLRSDFLRDELKSRDFPWPPKDEIDELERLEARYAAEHSRTALGTFVLPKDTLGVMIADLNGNGHRRGVERTLPQADLHFAVSADGNLVTTVTAEFGENLPAFTSAALLRQYLERVHAPETDRPTVATGRALVDVLVARGHVGLAVNPLGGHDAHGGQHWTPEELVGL